TNTAVSPASTTAASSAAASVSSAGVQPYWLSQKSSQTGRAPSTPSPARSSARRTATTSSPARNPAAASHSDRPGYTGGRPASAVTTTDPGWPASSCPQANTASSRCGEMTTTGSLSRMPFINSLETCWSLLGYFTASTNSDSRSRLSSS